MDSPLDCNTLRPAMFPHASFTAPIHKNYVALFMFLIAFFCQHQCAIRLSPYILFSVRLHPSVTLIDLALRLCRRS